MDGFKLALSVIDYSCGFQGIAAHTPMSGRTWKLRFTQVWVFNIVHLN